MKLFLFLLFAFVMSYPNLHDFCREQVALFNQNESHRNLANDIQVNDGKIKVDMSGAHGKDGKPGANRGGRASRNQTGQGGGHATKPTPGKDAGDYIKAQITSPSLESTSFIVDIEAVTPRGKLLQHTTEPLDFQGIPQVELLTVGGDAGHGARGGRGQQGGKGIDGADATRSSAAGDGERGATGGPGGLGTSGENAGDGKDVTIGVPVDELELLTLIRSKTYGGLKGKRGKHGAGGPGGPGGDGGSGTSWTETEYRTRTRTDSKGNTETYQESVTVVKSRPPGSDGPQGYSGSTPSSPLYDGTHGTDGRVTYEVINKDGSVTVYKERYHLNLVDYEIVSANRDKIIEPGEVISIKNLKVKNTGEMPLPAHVPVTVLLGNSEYYLSKGIELEVPMSLEPGASFTFDKIDLELQVKSNILPVGQLRSVVKDVVAPKAIMGRTNVELEEFQRKNIIDITFPLAIEPIDSLHSLSPGGASKYTLKITNISKKAFGSESELKRAIKFAVENQGGDLSNDQVHFYDTQGNELNLVDGIFKSIAHLGPGETNYFEGILALDPNVDSYRSTQISNKLTFQTLTEGEKVIQDKLISVNVSETYFNSGHSDYLLVANEGLTYESFTAWQETFQSIGAEASVWDLSYYDFFDMVKTIGEEGYSTNLLEDFRGKTIILLTNHFSNNERNSEVENFLKRSDIMQALLHYDIKFYFVGDNDKSKMWNAFLDPKKVKLSHAFDSESGKKLANEIVADNLVETVSESFDYTETEIVMKKTKWTWWGGKPQRELLIDEANSVSDRISKKAPEKDTLILHGYRPEIKKRLFWGLFKKWDVGEVSVLSRPDTNSVVGVHQVTSPDQLFDPNFVRSHENQKNILLATPFDDVARNYNNLLNSEELTPDQEKKLALYEEVILFNLIDEQNRLRRYTRKYGLSKSSLDKYLPKLKVWTEIDKPLLSKSSNPRAIESVIHISSYLNYYHRATGDWLSTLLQPYSTRHTLLRKYTEQKVERALASYFNFSPTAGLFSTLKNALLGRDIDDYYGKDEVLKEVKDQYLNLFSKLKEHIVAENLPMPEAFKRKNTDKGFEPNESSRPQNQVQSEEDYTRDQTENRLKSYGNESQSSAQRSRKDRLSVPHPGLTEKMNSIKGTAPQCDVIFK